MAITLGGVSLPDGMIWQDEFQQDMVAQTTLRTLGGTLKVREQGLSGGRNITLAAIEDQGWLTRAQVEAIQPLTLEAGNTYTLVIGVQTFTVKFRHSDPPAFEATPLIYRTTQVATDYFTATIKLMTV
jgi:hypothetical protein